MLKDKLNEALKEKSKAAPTNPTIQVSIGNIEQNFGYTFNIYTEGKKTTRKSQEGAVKSGKN